MVKTVIIILLVALVAIELGRVTLQTKLDEEIERLQNLLKQSYVKSNQLAIENEQLKETIKLITDSYASN